MPRTPPSPLARLEARIPSELHALVKRAAEVEGRTVTDYVTAALHEAAHRTVERADVLRLARADQERFVNALLSPPEPTPALKRAVARHRRLVASAQ